MVTVSSPDVTYVPDFVSEPTRLFETVLNETSWDQRLRARRTASFGVAYNYSGMSYPDGPLPPHIEELAARVAVVVKHPVNNCLANWYADGSSTMGFHSDSTEDLMPESTVAVVSLGAVRTLTFRLKEQREHCLDYRLESGALLIMAPSVQSDWQHALPKAAGVGPRISLTFRWVGPSSTPR